MYGKYLTAAVGAALVTIGLGGAATAGEASGPVKGTAVAMEQLDRTALIDVILGTWEPMMGDGIHVESGRSWRDGMLAHLSTVDDANLRRAARLLDYDQMMAALDGADVEADSPAAIGELDADLVYTPVTPCRIFDSRTGFPIGAGLNRGFDVSAWFNGSFTFQGGDDSDCGIPIRPAAVAVNLAAVAPAAAGYLTAYPHDTDRPLAATVNYLAGQIESNEVVIPANRTGGYDIRVYSHRESHVVGDIVGYYAAPEATALDCEMVSVTGIVIEGGGRHFQNVFCPAGYSAVSGGPYTPSNAGMRVESSTPMATGAWFISLANENATQRTSEFRARCCRVPGR